MIYQILFGDSVIGSSWLESRDNGIAVAGGRFSPEPGYLAVQSVFKKFWEELPELSGGDPGAVLLTEYCRARDTLDMRLRDASGILYETSWIHIIDGGDDAPWKVTMHIPDSRFWMTRKV